MEPIYQRELYLTKIRPFVHDIDIIKIITGVRRCGKSTIMRMVAGSTGIISLHYRQIPLLEWLYDDMRTSDHDIRYATELLDRDRQRIITEEAGARTVSAIDRLQEQIHADAAGVMQLQGVQIQGLRNLEAVSSDILYTTEDIYDSSKKILFHQRVDTADKVLREWRRHKAKQAAKKA